MVSRLLLVRREGFEPPAFWSVGCLKGKSESFRLRFVLFAAIRSADFPLFPSSPARSNSILGQKWVKHFKSISLYLFSRMSLTVSRLWESLTFCKSSAIINLIIPL